MKRELDRLTKQVFDVLIIGGGIHGAMIALEATNAGLETALIEKKDFSHATSSNSLKILHGGFRYLQSLDIKRMRGSIKSQAEFIKLAPNLIQPLGCIVPTYGYSVRGKLLMRTALLINDLIGWDRNRLAENSPMLGRGKILSKQDLIKVGCLNGSSDINGAALWYDALVYDTERLTITVLNNAYDNGACLANYLEAVKLVVRNKSVEGVRATDLVTGNNLEIRSRKIINATGPWHQITLDKLLNRKNIKMDLARGLNIIVKTNV